MALDSTTAQRSSDVRQTGSDFERDLQIVKLFSDAVNPAQYLTPIVAHFEGSDIDLIELPKEMKPLLRQIDASMNFMDTLVCWVKVKNEFGDDEKYCAVIDNTVDSSKVSTTDEDVNLTHKLKTIAPELIKSIGNLGLDTESLKKMARDEGALDTYIAQFIDTHILFLQSCCGYLSKLNEFDEPLKQDANTLSKAYVSVFDSICHLEHRKKNLEEDKSQLVEKDSEVLSYTRRVDVIKDEIASLLDPANPEKAKFWSALLTKNGLNHNYSEISGVIESIGALAKTVDDRAYVRACFEGDGQYFKKNSVRIIGPAYEFRVRLRSAGSDKVLSLSDLENIFNVVVSSAKDAPEYSDKIRSRENEITLVNKQIHLRKSELIDKINKDKKTLVTKFWQDVMCWKKYKHISAVSRSPR